MNVEIPEAAGFLFEDGWQFKVGYGGRVGIKSWSFARALLVKARSRRLRIGCARETMKSLDESVHQLLQDQIKSMELSDFFIPQRKVIRGLNGSAFTYHGLRDRSVHNIKSLEGLDILWIEEAQNVSKKSWVTVIPTILRKPGAEIWVSFNPELETDETYQRFVVHPPASARVVKTSFRDNPYLSEEIKGDIAHMKATDPEEYEHVYEGVCRPAVQGAVYKEQLVAAEKEKRITRVPYDASKPVDTFWDLGFGDSVAIWFAQGIGFEFRLIDFVTDHLKGMDFYLKELAKRPYLYRTAFLPHDARARTLAAAGRTVQQLVEAGGYRVRIVPNLSETDQMAATRAVFNRCWFDQEKCAEGIQALKHYKYEFDEQLGVFSRTPLHDWASHASKAFQYFAVSIREPERERARVEAQAPPVRVGVWS